jgi:hypothetical protein
MKKVTTLLIVSLVSFTLILLGFSERKTTKKDPTRSTIDIPEYNFKSGDIIFRDGRGFISNSFRRLSLSDPRYSHAGIIHLENDKVYVLHVIEGEENKNNRMRKDLLNDFCHSSQANSFAVYRTDLNAGQIDSMAMQYYKAGLEFDTKFELNTKEKMYCTEMVYNILCKISGKDNFLPLTVLSGIEYISCDNIYLSKHLSKIYSYEYSL